MLLLWSPTNEAIGRSCRPKPSDLSRSINNFHFHYALGFATQTLAHMSDSLVRVSRRVGLSNFVRIPNTPMGSPIAGHRQPQAELCSPKSSDTHEKVLLSPEGWVLRPQSKPQYRQGGCKRSKQSFNLTFLPPVNCESNWFWRYNISGINICTRTPGQASTNTLYINDTEKAHHLLKTLLF